MYTHVVHRGEAQASGFHPGGSSLCLGSRPGPAQSGHSASRSSCAAIVATIQVSDDTLALSIRIIYLRLIVQPLEADQALLGRIDTCLLAW